MATEDERTINILYDGDEPDSTLPITNETGPECSTTWTHHAHRLYSKYRKHILILVLVVSVILVYLHFKTSTTLTSKGTQSYSPSNIVIEDIPRQFQDVFK